MGGMRFLFNSGGERVLKVRVGACPGQRQDFWHETEQAASTPQQSPLPYGFAVFAAG